MTSPDETITNLDQFLAPWGKEILMQTVDYESGLKMMRILIREKSRFTTMDLDVETAARLARQLTNWCDAANRTMPLNSPPMAE